MCKYKGITWKCKCFEAVELIKPCKLYNPNKEPGKGCKPKNIAHVEDDNLPKSDLYCLADKRVNSFTAGKGVKSEYHDLGKQDQSLQATEKHCTAMGGDSRQRFNASKITIISGFLEQSGVMDRLRGQFDESKQEKKTD